MSGKVDLKREIATYRARPGRFDLVEVPDLTYLAVDGHGDPNGAAFAEATSALYPLAYTLKAASRAELGRDYVVPPLEGLWWADDWRAFTTARDKSVWDWTLLILVPDWVPSSMLEPARARVTARRDPARLTDVRLEPISEGRCVQTLHVGSFDDEAPVLARMHDEVVPERGLRLHGRHHEIYLSDPHRSPALPRSVTFSTSAGARPRPKRHTSRGSGAEVRA